MFLKHDKIEPARVTNLLKAAEAAARQVPPAFPLDATVAVNPFLGQSHEDLAHAAARLGRVAGARLTLPRSEYARLIETGEITDADLAAALFDSPSPLKPVDLMGLKAQLRLPGKEPEALPTVADLAARATGTDWPGVIRRSVGLWAAGHFDRGQALWTPAPGQGTFAAWRAWATNDLTPEIAGLSGFCAHVAEAPDTAERAILRASETLALTEAAAETAFHRLYADLGGWAQHARWLLWTAELDGRSDQALTDLLAVRMIWEEALFRHVPGLADDWAKVVASHEAPVEPDTDEVTDAILQEARERGFQRRMAAELAIPTGRTDRPSMQVACCIDVRSGPLRRALEELDPAIDTIGFAGFFGLPVSHRAHGTDLSDPHLPALLSPALHASSHLDAAPEQAARIRARTVRAWGRFRQAAVSSFAFVEAAGPVYVTKLVRDALGLGGEPAEASPAPRFDADLSAEDKAGLAAKVLTAMSLTKGHAPLVVLLGHGASTTNNPHESAYHCGACGGQAGDVSARLLAGLLNDHETRAGLPAHGIDIPGDTVFVAGLHDTTTDAVTLYPDDAGPEHVEKISQAKQVLRQAGRAVATGRAERLPGARADTVVKRALDWAEVRPEWGLAGCAAFVAAPRAHLARNQQDGRTFLHSYDWTSDKGFATLELILTAPAVVASWISLQYYGSAVAPEVFGGGNKLIHNVTSGIGVVEGNGGVLRAGLPKQALHDGEKPVHDPLRLSVLIEAPEEAIQTVLDQHDEVRALFDNGWMHLFALKSGRLHARYRPGKGWTSPD
ncbi:YbcC family protein [Thalassococcus sp. BH17M4-6]|uniref:YbcC family protein n=1 Tax=Thalassococcus sp. BH17M4-6 TaxID=3413148 RepID=UPI003BDE17AE